LSAFAACKPSAILGKSRATRPLNKGHHLGYDGVAFFRTEAVEYKFEQANNTYWIPKYYPDWARQKGIDPESEVPYACESLPACR
jgi:hypothetical protein